MNLVLRKKIPEWMIEVSRIELLFKKESPWIAYASTVKELISRIIVDSIRRDKENWEYNDIILITKQQYGFIFWEE